jgi:hypothetical protein
MERWPSGLRRSLGKRVYGKLYRGFESRPLRQPFKRRFHGVKAVLHSAVFDQRPS